MNHLFLGLGYGDEGKGRVISQTLLSQPSSQHGIVIRFNGGAQAGHTVNYNGIQHIFSHYGSGTLQGFPTYWSHFCPVNPMAAIVEFYRLEEQGITPCLYVHPKAPLTLPGDIATAQAQEKVLKHGSCGVGVGETIRRHEQTPWRFYAEDLAFPNILAEKLKLYCKANIVFPLQILEDYLRICRNFYKTITIKDYSYLNTYENKYFEGAQGILLDQEAGYFPHVTRSYTTARNALEILGILNEPLHRAHFITRTYATRHGNGPLLNESRETDIFNLYSLVEKPCVGPKPFKINPYETNVINEYQGIFRSAPLSEEHLIYAIKKSGVNPGITSCDLNVTCLDLTDGKMSFDQYEQTPNEFINHLAKQKIFLYEGIMSTSPITSH